MAKDTTASKKPDPRIGDLLEYLKSTGTGQGKLDALNELAKDCDSREEFLARAAKAVPEGTMEKIATFYSDNKEPPRVTTMQPAASGPNPPAVIQPARSSTEMANQKVNVGDKGDKAGATGQEGDQPESPVADKNADEAISSIAAMRSKEKLQEIVSHDTRVTVRKAAEDRLKGME